MILYFLYACIQIKGLPFLVSIGIASSNVSIIISVTCFYPSPSPLVLPLPLPLVLPSPFYLVLPPPPPTSAFHGKVTTKVYSFLNHTGTVA